MWLALAAVIGEPRAWRRSGRRRRGAGGSGDDAAS
jgi:hypothetical protein